MALFDLKNEYERQNFLEYVKRLAKDAPTKDTCIVEVKRRYPQRTTNQNKYLHVLLGYFAQEFGYSLDEVKQDYFKKTCNAELFYRTKVNKRGQEVKYLRSSSDLTTAEMSLAIDRFRDYSSAVAGLYLPSAGETDFLIHCEKMIENYKEYE